MGARTPSTLRPRRGAIKCEYCGRSLANLNAYKSHQNALHASALKRKVRQQVAKKLSRPLVGKPKVNVEPGKSGRQIKKVLVSKLHKPTKKTVSSHNAIEKSVKKSNLESKVENTAAPSPKTVKESQSKPNNINKQPKLVKAPHKMETDKGDESAPVVEAKPKNSNKKVAKKRKIEFKCPKCEKLFPIYFKAQKHIQKYHSENSAGDDVSFDSPVLIQPIQVEPCSYCDDYFTGAHDCPNALKRELSPYEEPCPGTLDLDGPYSCSACQKTFDRIVWFQKHVTSMHNDGLESMLFPTLEEFETWRGKMELQTKTHYNAAGRVHGRFYRNFYRCLGISEQNTLSCPSLIVYQEYPKGIQVHFYKYHYEHEYKPYCMEDSYKSYSITDMLQKDPATATVQVKKEAPPEEQVDEEAEERKDIYIKFKTLMENIIMDAAKIDIDSLKVLSDKALEMHSLLNRYDEDEDNGLDNGPINSQHSELKTCANKRKHESITSPLRKKLRSALRKAQAHKSPILQRVKKSTTHSYSLADDKDSDKILQELDEKPEMKKKEENEDAEESKEVRAKSPKLLSKLQVPVIDRSPSAFNDSYKDFVTSVISKGDRKQKLVPRNDLPEKKIKTKMGQFNPNSPKKQSSKNNNVPQATGPPKKNTAKGGPKSKRKNVVKDFKYEVKERDNDCNILILKF